MMSTMMYPLTCYVIIGHWNKSNTCWSCVCVWPN